MTKEAIAEKLFIAEINSTIVVLLKLYPGSTETHKASDHTKALTGHKTKIVQLFLNMTSSKNFAHAIHHMGNHL